jgi:hypothetical protein
VTGKGFALEALAVARPQPALVLMWGWGRYQVTRQDRVTFSVTHFPADRSVDFLI